MMEVVRGGSKSQGQGYLLSSFILLNLGEASESYKHFQEVPRKFPGSPQEVARKSPGSP